MLPEYAVFVKVRYGYPDSIGVDPTSPQTQPCVNKHPLIAYLQQISACSNFITAAQCDNEARVSRQLSSPLIPSTRILCFCIHFGVIAPPAFVLRNTHEAQAAAPLVGSLDQFAHALSGNGRFIVNAAVGLQLTQVGVVEKQIVADYGHRLVVIYCFKG